MRDETLVELGLEHPVADDPLVCHVEVGLRLVVGHVDVCGIEGPPNAPSLLKPFILQFVPGRLPVPLHAANIA